MECVTRSIPGCGRPLTDDVAHRRRLARSVARWIVVGAGVGIVTSITLLAVGSPRTATDTAFALGILVAGFGVAAWSGTIALGNSIERLQEHRDSDSEWTQAGARQAFAVLTWVGFGWTVASVAASAVAVGV